jgi:hypothetical protein
MRMGRQWLHLKELKWFGFGHTKKKPGPGDLALFCAGCPQPGVNLSQATWNALAELMDQPNLQIRSFAVDGNFSAVHQRQRADADDVWLKAGESFFVEKSAYQNHLRIATEIKQVSFAAATISHRTSMFAETDL